MLNLIELPGAVQVLQAVGKNIKNVGVSLSDGVGVFNADIGFLQKGDIIKGLFLYKFFSNIRFHDRIHASPLSYIMQGFLGGSAEGAVMPFPV